MSQAENSVNPSSFTDKETPLAISVDAKNIEIEKGKVPIAVAGFRGFLAGSSFLHLLVNLNLLWATICLCFFPNLTDRLLTGYKSVGNGYDIFCTIAIVLCLVALSTPFIARTSISVAIYFVLWITYLYLAIFVLRTKVHDMNRSNWPLFVCIYAVLISGSIGLFFGCLFATTKVNMGFGIVMAVVSGVAYQCMMYFLTDYKFGLWQWKGPAFLIAVVMWAGLLLTDAQLMITKRANFYTTEDKFLGAGGFFTDIFFNMWKDMFVKQKNVERIEITDKDAQSTATLDL